jgi:N-acetyl-anhydromuramyl-L-alanine amidase AmpD
MSVEEVLRGGGLSSSVVGHLAQLSPRDCGGQGALVRHAEPSPNRGYPAAKRRVRLIVWHITEGSLRSSLDWLASPMSQASANDVVSRDGHLYVMVPSGEAPWTNGRLCRPTLTNPIIEQSVRLGVNPNVWSHTIECVGWSSWGRGGSLTDVQTAALIARTAEICLAYRLTADPTHIVGHMMFDACDREGCPGFAEREWASWRRAVQTLAFAARGW